MDSDLFDLNKAHGTGKESHTTQRGHKLPFFSFQGLGTHTSKAFIHSGGLML